MAMTTEARAAEAEKARDKNTNRKRRKGRQHSLDPTLVPHCSYL
jgi:hypothetical protein